MKTILATLLAALAVAAVAGGAMVHAGWYDVAATAPHTHLGYHLLHYAMRRSVKARAADISVPELGDPARIRQGQALFQAHCQQCHGGPGVPPDPFARGLRPQPTNLAQDGREWPPNEIYWVVKHGVRMTPMPGWEFRLSDAQLWDVVAFVKHLPLLTPAQYQASPGAPPRPPTTPEQPSHAPDAARGKYLIDQYMCATCHSIPGVAGANHTVGPPLAGIARRSFIGGSLPNTPENMVRWLRDPQAIRPQSAMPRLDIGEAEARDIAAYLYTLDTPR